MAKRRLEVARDPGEPPTACLSQLGHVEALVTGGVA
ncbi:hypothetical protein HAL1_07600 [Halomonas sp. HAL1]|jgi:hypothetical protein|nr:hypothetical protein HAL1_07600 [Halomonas sp. HAL1]|tara:strand:- start:3200 stop:3307 length:108 start_codon:yes stop_codon:yes gene_type:complete